MNANETQAPFGFGKRGKTENCLSKNWVSCDKAKLIIHAQKTDFRCRWKNKYDSFDASSSSSSSSSLAPNFRLVR